jgi:hypothetical protein
VLGISPERLKEVVTEEPALCDIFLKAFLARRSYAMKAGAGQGRQRNHGISREKIRGVSDLLAP